MCSTDTSTHFTTSFVQRTAQTCLVRPSVSDQLGSQSSNDNSQCALDGMTSEGSSDVTMFSKDSKADTQEAQSHPSTTATDVEELILKVKAMEALLTNTFATVSSLKNAYIQLQSAHSPFRPEKLQLADKAMVLEFKRLSELKHKYKTRIRDTETKQEGGLGYGAYKEALKEIQVEVQRKTGELRDMGGTVERLALKKEKLERRIRRLERRSMRGLGINGAQELSLTAELFESVVSEAKEAAHTFTKLLMTHMESAKWDLDAAANSIEPGLSYAKQSHKKYAFQSYVCLRMFNGFENENFYLTGSLSSIMDPAKHKFDCFRQFQDMQYMDPLELVCITPECLFGKFCHKKFLYIVHPKMEESFFGNFEHRNHILSGSHPRSHFYEIFLKFAKAVWLVHKLAFSFDPVANIFQVRKGADYFAAYMESVVQNVEMDHETRNLLPKVGFTVMPGFRLGKSTIKCEVYLNGMKMSN